MDYVDLPISYALSITYIVSGVILIVVGGVMNHPWLNLLGAALTGFGVACHAAHAVDLPIALNAGWPVVALLLSWFGIYKSLQLAGSGHKTAATGVLYGSIISLGAALGLAVQLGLDGGIISSLASAQPRS